MCFELLVTQHLQTVKQNLFSVSTYTNVIQNSVHIPELTYQINLGYTCTLIAIYTSRNKEMINAAHEIVSTITIKTYKRVNLLS